MNGKARVRVKADSLALLSHSRSLVGTVTLRFRAFCSLLSQVPCYGPSATWALSWSDRITLPSLAGTTSSLWCIPLKGTRATCPVSLPEHAYSYCEGLVALMKGTWGPRT